MAVFPGQMDVLQLSELLAGDVKQSRNDVAIRLTAEAVRSSQTLVLLPHRVFLINQYQSEYATWKPQSHSKAIEMNACPSSAKFKVGLLVVNSRPPSGMIAAPGRRYAIRSPETTEVATPR
jgi:hypothetical protein